jgi:hypothetical protein
VLSCIVLAVALGMAVASGQNQSSDRSPATSEPTQEEELASARRLLSQVERSPSANSEELRAKLREARAATQAVLKKRPQHPEAMKLIARIDSLLAHLGPRSRPEHPAVAEAGVTLDRLIALVKGGAARNEVEEAHTQLRRLARRLEGENLADAARYKRHALELWNSYASRLAQVDGVCAECPTLDVASLTEGFDNPRMLGAGDYTLEELDTMQEDPAKQKPAYAPLVTGHFDQDGSIEVALIGQGSQKGTVKLFVLIASPQKTTYRRLFVQPLDWHTAALAVKDTRLILSEAFHAGDDFWFVVWNGKTFDFRYAGDEMDPGPQRHSAQGVRP